MDRATLARMIDHTLLRPEATADDVEALCVEATELGVAAVCVSPSQLPIVAGLGPGIAVAAVIGFPSGAHQPAVKAHEAEVALDAGATELDMVVNLGLVKAGEWRAVGDDIGAVRASAGAALVKVIIESAALTDDEIVQCCVVARSAGADFVKTSTGFHPSGGASVEAVRLMRATVPELGVKASGGIRDAATALAMVEAGATRLGCSASRAILGGIA
jgi:deoxyribose-phosphate aldolase